MKSFYLPLIIFIIWSKCSASETPQQRQSIPFPKILWLYWHQDISNASTFTKLCLKNQKYYAQTSGWTFNLLTYSTLHKYLNVSKVDELWAKAGIGNLQSRSDIVRLSLLSEYGGMWMDANGFFIQNLEWVDEVKNKPHIYNKLGEQPDVILSSLAYKKVVPIVKKDKKQGIDVLLNPNHEAWFIIAKPKSKFLLQVMKTLQKICQLGFQRSNQYYRSQGIVSVYFQMKYFFVSNYLFLVVLQLKQIEFDQKNSQKFAVEYYKVWNFNGAESAFAMQQFYNFQSWTMVSDIFSKSLRQFQESINGPNYFVKFTSSHFPMLQQMFENYVKYNCWGIGYVIEKGSLIDQFLLRFAEQNEEAYKIVQFNKKIKQKEETANFCEPISQQINRIYYAWIFAFFLISYLLFQSVLNIIKFLKKVSQLLP